MLYYEVHIRCLCEINLEKNRLIIIRSYQVTRDPRDSVFMRISPTNPEEQSKRTPRHLTFSDISACGKRIQRTQWRVRCIAMENMQIKLRIIRHSGTNPNTC